jgi:hypothetical protein
MLRSEPIEELVPVPWAPGPACSRTVCPSLPSYRLGTVSPLAVNFWRDGLSQFCSPKDSITHQPWRRYSVSEGQMQNRIGRVSVSTSSRAGEAKAQTLESSRLQSEAGLIPWLCDLEQDGSSS